MKYKVNDIVEIKKDQNYNSEALCGLKENNYILTITSVHPERFMNSDGFYRVKEFEFMVWREKYIKCLYKKQILDPIYSRFEILDL